jgi:hypothetical protein
VETGSTPRRNSYVGHAVRWAAPLPAPTATPGNAGEVVAGCRVYVVVTNPDPEPIAQLRLDLILFGADGVIARRVPTTDGRELRLTGYSQPEPEVKLPIWQLRLQIAAPGRLPK